MQAMQPHLRHYFGPYNDGVDYFVFISGSGGGIRWEHVKVDEVTKNQLDNADVVFKLTPGAFAIVDQMVSGTSCDQERESHFFYEVHRCRDMSAKKAGDLPLGQNELHLGGGPPPPPSGCSATCGGHLYTKLSCAAGSSPVCNASNTGINCVILEK